VNTTSKKYMTEKERNERTRTMLRNFCIAGVNQGYVSLLMIQELVDEEMPRMKYRVEREVNGFSLVKFGRYRPETMLKERYYIVEPCSYERFKREIAVLCKVITKEEYRAQHRAKRLENDLYNKEDYLKRLYEEQDDLKKEMKRVEDEIDETRQTISKMANKLHVQRTKLYK